MTKTKQRENFLEIEFTDLKKLNISKERSIQNAEHSPRGAPLDSVKLVWGGVSP